MASAEHRDELGEFIDETRSKQRNIVFPDTVRNARSVDAFMWKGSPNPSWVQRIGAWLFSMAMFGPAAGFAYMSIEARKDDELAGFIIMGLASLGSLAVGLIFFRNGFPRRPKRQLSK